MSLDPSNDPSNDPDSDEPAWGIHDRPDPYRDDALLDLEPPPEEGGPPEKPFEDRAAAVAAELDELQRVLDEYAQKVWTAEELLADAVMLEDGAFVTFLSCPQIALPFAQAKTLLGASVDAITNPRTGHTTFVSRLDKWNRNPLRMQAYSRTHAPGQPLICADPLGRRCVNLWRPRPHTPPANAAALVQPFLDHIAFLVPDKAERERFLDWLAHIEQQPDVRPHNHYLLRTRGGQGVGRNWVGEVLARVWLGNVATNVDLLNMLGGGFNGLVAGSMLGIVDELHVAVVNVSLGKLTEALKGELTATRRNVKPKYGREYVEWCCTRWLMFSNHVAALPLPHEDRRVTVIENPNVGRDEGYYSRLYGLLGDPNFIAAVRDFLIRRDIRNFNPGAHAVMNDAKRETVNATRSENDIAAADVAANWPCDVILSADLTTELTDSNGEPPTGPQLRFIAQAAGMRSYGKRIKFGGKPHNCWLIRNHEHWLAATGPELLAEIRRGRPAGITDEESLDAFRERQDRENTRKALTAAKVTAGATPNGEAKPNGHDPDHVPDYDERARNAAAAAAAARKAAADHRD